MDIAIINERINKAKEVLQKTSEERVEMVRQFVGKHYGNSPSKKKMPTNMLEMAVTIYLRNLAARAPKCEVKTEVPSLYSMATNFQIIINQVLNEIGVVKTIRKAIMEAMFSMGIVKVGISSVSDDPKVGDEPFVSLVQLDDYFVDMSAKSWDEIQFEGNEYWMDTETIKKFYGVDLTSDEYAGISSQGVEQAKAIELDQEIEPLFGRVLLRDVYIVKTNTLITYAVNSMKVLRETKWDGPFGTPYIRLCFTEVPGNLLPLPPASVWTDMNELANTIFRKIANQAMSKKTVVAIQGGNDEEITGFKLAQDGEAIRVNGAKVDSLTAGGVDTQLLATFIQIRDLFSIFAGNLDSLGGLSPQSETAAQDKIISEAASVRLNSMSDNVEEFVCEIMKRIAWYVWTDPVRVRKYRKVFLKKFNLGIDKEWTPETRDGDFLDYNFSVAALSMQDDSPSVRVQKLANAFNTFILPLVPMFEAMGVAIDIRALADYLAKNANIPELKDMIITMSAQPQGERQVAASQFAKPAYISTKSPVTHRVYERINRPAATRQGRDAALMQTLLGGNPQAAEKAGLAAGRSIA